MHKNIRQVLTLSTLLALSSMTNAAEQFCHKADAAGNVYYWNETTQAKVSAWPGVALQFEADGLYCIDIDTSIAPSHVIFIPAGGTQTGNLPYDGTNGCYMNDELTSIYACKNADEIIPSNTGMQVTVNDDPEALAEALVGDGIEMSNFSYTGLIGSAGTFTGGSSSIGIASGIILTTGGAYGSMPSPIPDNFGAKAAENVDPTAEAASGAMKQATDTELENYLGVNNMHDAAVLEFDFETTTGELYFEYVFASEAYNQFVNSEFNDAFALFVDGKNIATLANGGGVVSINNVNNGTTNKVYSSKASNSLYYIDNNTKYSNSASISAKPIIYNGFTVVLTAKASGLVAGKHKMKFVIADMSDTDLDSAIFVKAGSFKAEPAEPKAPTCEVLNGEGSSRSIHVKLPKEDIELDSGVDWKRQGELYARKFGVEHIEALTNKQAWADRSNVYSKPDAIAVHMDAGIGNEGSMNKSHVFSSKVQGEKSAYKFWGYIVPPESGDYEFAFNSDDGIQVFLNYDSSLQLVVDKFEVGQFNSLYAEHSAGNFFELEASEPYAFQMVWFSWGGEEFLEMTYSLNGGAFQAIPKEWFYPSTSTTPGDGDNVISGENTGLKQVYLQDEDKLILDQSQFEPGLYEWYFTASLTDLSADGSGTVMVEAYNGLTATCYVEISGEPIEPIDEQKPECSITAQTSQLIGSATDELYTASDVGHYNSGLAAIDLTNSSNLQLIMDEALAQGIMTASFKIVLVDPMESGQGALLVTDVAGNISVPCDLHLDNMTNPTVPVAIALSYLQNPTGSELTGKKTLTIKKGGVVYLDSSDSSDVDNDIVERHWEIENHNGFNSSSTLSPYTFVVVGTHTVTLTVTDAYGLSSTDSLTVIVEALPVEPPKPENQLPTTEVISTTVDGVPLSELDYLPKGYVIDAKGTAKDVGGSLVSVSWRLLDEDEHVIMEYLISTTPEVAGTMVDGKLVAGKYKLTVYPYGELIDNPVVLYVDDYENVKIKVDQEGRFKVALYAYDDTGAMSETTENNTSSVVGASNLYVESGSLGLFSGLFLVLSLLIRRKIAC